VLGVDDFALRRGRSYGTVLVDMETRRPVDVLAGRSSPVLAGWLAAHPGAGVICRDRASAYADAAATAAPDAVQVADRWHLWINLVEATEKCVISHRGCLRDPATGPPDLAALSLDTTLNRRIQARYAAVQELVSAGTSYREISRQLGLGRNTVRRYARPASVDELLDRAARPANLDEFKPYLHQRFAAGHTRPSRLFEEISARGYTGSFPNVRDYVRRLRIWAAASPGQGLPPSVREVTRWITCHPAALEAADRNRLHAVLGRCPELTALHDRVREFAVIMAHRRGHHLDQWLASAQAAGLPGLASFAAGVRHDHAAVTAALTLPWSSGTVEGHVNRIKMLKRQMYGRAGIDLLRKRVILAT
jgi:transposase